MDKTLVFEHALREHVLEQRNRCENVLAEYGVGEHSRSVDISFDASDGGRWSVRKWAAKGTAEGNGAELVDAVDTWIMTYERMNKTKVLRSLIAGPATGDDNIPF